MSRAEDKALEAYPLELDNKCEYNAPMRVGFKIGYEQAEKDHTLTWQDIKRIIKIADDMIHEYPHDTLVAMGEQEYHEEVLRRYNNIK